VLGGDRGAHPRVMIGESPPLGHPFKHFTHRWTPQPLYNTIQRL